MKKLLLTLVGFGALFGLASCNDNPNDTTSTGSEFDSSKKITVYTRDRESGTRDGFFTAIGHSEAKSDNTLLAPGAATATSNGDMMSKVKADEYGIGYASLASVMEDDGVKGLKFNGVEATNESVVDGTYKLSRNFNYVVRKDEDMSENEALMVYAFTKYMFSREGMSLVSVNDGILTTSLNDLDSWNDIKASDDKVKQALAIEEKVTINLGGSTSVEKIAEALTESFKGLVPNFVASHNHTGSGDAFKYTQGEQKDEAGKLHIGFLSRELEASETVAEGTSGMICKDGIVCIINPENDLLEDADSALLWDIFSGKITTWADVK